MSLFAPNQFKPLPDDIGYNKITEVIRNPYCTVADVARYLHRHDLDIGTNTPEEYDEMVAETIAEAEREIDMMTKRTFHKIRRLEWHHGQADSDKILDYYPILRLNSVKVYSPGFQTFHEYDANFFMVDNEAGSIHFPTILYSQTSLIQQPLSAIGYAFLPGKKNVLIDYWAGFDEGVPDTGYHAGIRNATAQLATSMLLEEAESRQSQGLMSLNITGEGTQYGRWSIFAQQLRTRAERNAARYRRVMIGGMHL